MTRDRILRLPAVQEVTGLSKTTLWRLRNDGEFPAPRRLGGRAIGWVASEVEAWIASRPPATLP